MKFRVPVPGPVEFVFDLVEHLGLYVEQVEMAGGESRGDLHTEDPRTGADLQHSFVAP
ncbi:Uncharacterised protein [Mycobacteroides abscessus subsp. massiliense]|nr:Uncharacterised protein [Mycobacteroides abscessus subsp. massiliense]